MRERFSRGYIEEELREIGEGIDGSLRVYLIGGGAMSFLGLKDATKDIDIVVTDTSDLTGLADALESRGYEQVNEPDTEYEELGASVILENPDRCRFDVFDRQVADKLIFSEGMEQRADELLQSGSLTVQLTSPEDIFLFNSVAGRPADIDEMNTLVQTGLEFEAVKQETEVQTELLGEELFITHIAESLADLQERHGVTTPLMDYVESRSEDVYEAGDTDDSEGRSTSING